MTVCIATRCLENNSFILAGDRLFSYGSMSLDSMSLKRAMITPDYRWKVMFAASPISHVMPIVRRMRHLLMAGNYSVPYDLEAIGATSVRSYQEERERLVNETILSKYKTTLAEWRTQASNFGPTEVARMNRLIDDLAVGVQLIVYGYDSHNVAHLFTLEEPGTYEDCDMEGIAIVGSGGGYAQQSLISGDLPIVSQAEMMCRVLEAKFAAEQDANVGTDTCAGVVNQPSSSNEEAPERFLRNSEMLAVRNAIQNNQTRPFPSDVIDAVKKGIGSSLTSAEVDHAVTDLLNAVAAKQKP